MTTEGIRAGDCRGPSRIRVQDATRLTEQDVTDLGLFDASFETTTVYEVQSRPDGFELRERTLEIPFRKRYDLTAELTGTTHPWEAVFFARDEERLAGVPATTWHEWNRRQILNELHVARAYRGRGLARELLTHVRARARANQAREMHVETQAGNHPAIQVYRRLGFRLTGVDVSRYPDTDEVAVFLSAPA